MAASVITAFYSIKPDTVSESSKAETRITLPKVASDTNEPKLSPEERMQLFAFIAKRVQEDLTTEAVRTELVKIQEEQKEAAKRNQLFVWSDQAARRLTQQIAALGSRANINLFIGLVLAISGIVFLVVYVMTSLVDDGAQLTRFVIHFFSEDSFGNRN